MEKPYTKNNRQQMLPTQLLSLIVILLSMPLYRK